MRDIFAASRVSGRPAHASRIAHVSLLVMLALASPAAVAVRALGQPAAKPNVLVIFVDDLNHWVGPLGRNKQAITPNIDRLAARGVTFASAHTAAPACNPSRAALMSGLRPSTTGVYDNTVDWRPHIGRDKTLITLFRANGYTTLGAGKIYHGAYDRTDEWDEYGTERQKPCARLNPTDGVGGIKFSPVDCGDDAIADTSIADYGIAQLRRSHAKPFLLTIGSTSRTCPGTCRRSTSTCTRSMPSSCRRIARTISATSRPRASRWRAAPDRTRPTDHPIMN